MPDDRYTMETNNAAAAASLQIRSSQPQRPHSATADLLNVRLSQIRETNLIGSYSKGVIPIRSASFSSSDGSGRGVRKVSTCGETTSAVSEAPPVLEEETLAAEEEEDEEAEMQEEDMSQLSEGEQEQERDSPIVKHYS
jgi:hypothetical protein